jgi:hypothetical protein
MEHAMAEAAGTEILVQLLDGQSKLQEQMKGVQEQVKELSVRMDRTNDTLMLFGSVIQQLTQTVKLRIDNHETRIAALEGA